MILFLDLRKSCVRRILAGCCLINLISFLAAQSAAQNDNQQKPFGSSLERLKWDPRRKVAVDVPDYAGRKDQKQQITEDDDVIRVDANLVVSDVLVVDREGHAIQGLGPSDFTVTEEGQLQSITTFAVGENTKVPRSIVLIIDYSGSQLPYIDASVEAAKTLVDQLSPSDRMAIVTDNVALLLGFTSDKAKLKASLESLKQQVASGGALSRSMQYSALMAALRELLTGRERPVVIFQTDGDELIYLQPSPPALPANLKAEAREFGIVDLIAAAENARATIYSIIPGVRLFGLPPADQIQRAKAAYEKELLEVSQKRPELAQYEIRNGLTVKAFNKHLENRLKSQMALEGLAKLTGGWAEFLEDPKQASQIYSRILTDINHRYILGYQPTNKSHDGKRRRVGIAVAGHPDYVVWGRKAYYAPAQ